MKKITLIICLFLIFLLWFYKLVEKINKNSEIQSLYNECQLIHDTIPNWLDSVVVRADNDYVSYNDTLSLRKKTPENVKKKLKKYFKKYSENNTDYEKDNLIFKVSYSKYIDLYVVKYFMFNYIGYYFFGYNKSNNKISQNPYQINGKWINDNESGFIRKLNSNPLLSVDTDSKNKYSIVLKERVHNGNSYDAIIEHYLSLDRNMNFQLLFCIESVYQYVSPEMDMYNDVRIYRTYSKGKVYCVLNIDNQEEINIGNFEIDIDSQRIKNREILNSDYSDYLITGSGIDEIQFLREGYTFVY